MIAGYSFLLLSEVGRLQDVTLLRKKGTGNVPKLLLTY